MALGVTLLFALVPAALADRAVAALGRRIYRRNGRRPRQLRANLRAALGAGAPEAALNAAAEEVYASYAIYMAEFFTLAWPDFWGRRRRVVTADVAHLEKALESGRGVVLIGIHGGNWDMAASEHVRRYGPFHSAGETVKPAWLGRLTNAIRRRGGVELHEAEAAGLPLLRALRRGETVGLVVDRVVVGDGLDVTLCGRRASLPKGPLVLAMRTGAPLIPTVIQRQPNLDLRIELLPPVDLNGLDRGPEGIAIAAQRMADSMTILIQRGYKGWFALQPVWPDVRAE